LQQSRSFVYMYFNNREINESVYTYLVIVRPQ